VARRLLRARRPGGRLVRKVRDQRGEVAAGAGRVGRFEALLELLHVEPALGAVLAQLGGDLLALGVGDA